MKIDDVMRDVYKAIEGKGKYAPSPSLRQMARKLGISTSAVDRRVKRLIQNGYVTGEPRKVGTLVITGKKLKEEE